MQTPNQIASSKTESAHQQAFFAYCAFAKVNGFKRADLWAQYKSIQSVEIQPMPCLEWIHASGNGAMMGDTPKARAIRANRMKAEGMKPGVSDIFLPFPYGEYAGLYIELKRPELKPKREGSKGGLSEDQIKFITHSNLVGYFADVCYGWEEAVNLLKWYLKVG